MALFFYVRVHICMQSARAQVLGFKFQYYQREQVTQATPQSLYRLAGRLIKEDLVDINAL